MIAGERAITGVDESMVVDLLELMVSTPSPAGQERRLAERLAIEGARVAPELTWWVDGFDGDRANLLVTTGDRDYRDVDLLLLAHLDTSLSGEVEYRRLHGDAGSSTGWTAELGRTGDLVHGPGVAVAKGPAAGALAALVTAVRAQALPPGVAVLLSAGGTHRADPGSGFAAGLHRALDAGLSPSATVNVKAGAPAVLHEEPGSAYVDVEVNAVGGPAMLRASSGNAGAAQVLASIAAPVDAWRRAVRAAPTVGTSGREVAIGALRAGLPDKPDMLPSQGWAHLSVVFAPDDDIHDLVGDLEHELARHGLHDAVRVSVRTFMNGGRTDPSHPLVVSATRLWEQHFGPAAAVEGWCGSTDGALLRSLGFPVVRLGPRPRTAPDGTEALDLRELVTFAQIDFDLIRGHPHQIGEP